MKIEVVTRVETERGLDFTPAPDLRKTIEQHLGQTLESYLHNLLTQVASEVSREISLDDFFVRIVHADKPKLGFSFKRPGEYGHPFPARKSGDIVPDMVVGFHRDCAEFAKNIIHEGLHCFQWDELMVEAKTQEIYTLSKHPWEKT